MKKQQLVQIPVGHVCISAHDFSMLNLEINELQTARSEYREKINILEHQKTVLSQKLGDSVEKVSDLEKELNEKQDRVLYWYQKYTDLADKLNAVKDHAETEEA